MSRRQLLIALLRQHVLDATEKQIQVMCHQGALLFRNQKQSGPQETTTRVMNQVCGQIITSLRFVIVTHLFNRSDLEEGSFRSTYTRNYPGNISESLSNVLSFAQELVQEKTSQLAFGTFYNCLKTWIATYESSFTRHFRSILLFYRTFTSIKAKCVYMTNLQKLEKSTNKSPLESTVCPT